MWKSRDEFWQLSPEEKGMGQNEMLHGQTEVDEGGVGLRK